MDGKELEKLLQESCKIQRVDCTRLRDAGWQGETTQRRFTVKNICDFILYYAGQIIFLECKHSKGSLALSRLTQQKDLIAKASQGIDGVFCGYLAMISNELFFIKCQAIEDYAKGKKKSINRYDAASIGVKIMMFTPLKARKERIDVVDMFCGL